MFTVHFVFCVLTLHRGCFLLSILLQSVWNIPCKGCVQWSCCHLHYFCSGEPLLMTGPQHLSPRSIPERWVCTSSTDTRSGLAFGLSPLRATAASFLILCGTTSPRNRRGSALEDAEVPALTSGPVAPALGCAVLPGASTKRPPFPRWVSQRP